MIAGKTEDIGMTAKKTGDAVTRAERIEDMGVTARRTGDAGMTTLPNVGQTINSMKTTTEEEKVSASEGNTGATGRTAEEVAVVDRTT